MNERASPLNESLNDSAGHCTAHRNSTAQDGLERLPVDFDAFDVLFLGGSTAWKLGPAAADLAYQALARGLAVHMGRVNSRQRLAHAAANGCRSADGTHLAYAPDRNLPRLLAWLADLDPGTAEDHPGPVPDRWTGIQH